MNMTEPFGPFESDWNFAFGFSGEMDPKIFKVNVDYITNYYGNQSSRTVEYGLCEETFFDEIKVVQKLKNKCRRKIK